MNPLHYPSLKLCKKLTDIGFPKTEKKWVDGKRGVCPSVMEMLDTLKNKIICIESMQEGIYELSIQIMNKYENFQGTLPNALAEAILWLHENKYISFNQ